MVGVMPGPRTENISGTAAPRTVFARTRLRNNGIWLHGTLENGIMVGLALESSRGPLDFSESESELVAGLVTEYSGLGFMAVVLSEYSGILITVQVPEHFLADGSLVLVFGLAGFSAAFYP